MTTLRVAVELKSGVVQLTVLCHGCWTELLERMRAERNNVRSWSRETVGGHCEFCIDAASREAL